MRFQNKVCIVTGGNSGIGKATCLRLAKEGGKVVIVARSRESGIAVEQEIIKNGGEAFFISADVGVADKVKFVVDETLKKWNRIDILVNNAAMMSYEPLTELPEEDWDKLIAVNLKAIFLFCKYCIPHIEGGAIINVSSVHAHDTTANVIPYAASKGAMEAFTRGLSREYGHKKLRANCVAPGAVNTPMLWENPNVKSGVEKVEGAIGQPEDIASAICYLASDEAAFINGATLVADGGRLNIL